MVLGPRDTEHILLKIMDFPMGFNWDRPLRQSEAWMGGYEDIWRLVTMMENHPRVAASMGYAGNLCQNYQRSEFRYV